MEFKDYIKQELEILEGEGFEVKYMKGMSSKVLVKKFKDQKSYEKWLEKNEDDIEVLGFRDDE